MQPEILIAICVAVVIVFALLMGILSRYRKCPSDKILVIYGKVGSDKNGQARSAKCVHGGAAFIMPIIQSYQFMDLTPISINVDLKNALSKQNIRVDVPSRFTVGISTEPGIMQNAAERLLGLRMNEIQELAKDIIFGQLRLVVATMEIEEITSTSPILRTNQVISRRSVRKLPQRLSTMQRNPLPKRIVTVRSVRLTHSVTSVYRSLPQTLLLSRVRTSPRLRSLSLRL